MAMICRNDRLAKANSRQKRGLRKKEALAEIFGVYVVLAHLFRQRTSRYAEIVRCCPDVAGIVGESGPYERRFNGVQLLGQGLLTPVIAFQYRIQIARFRAQ